jgi:hypothetical protein
MACATILMIPRSGDQGRQGIRVKEINADTTYFRFSNPKKSCAMWPRARMFEHFWNKSVPARKTIKCNSKLCPSVKKFLDKQADFNEEERGQ